MTKLVDGIEFPDEMSDDDIMKALDARSGTAVPPTANPAAGPSPSEAAGQPSFTQRMLTNLKGIGQASYDELRALNRGITLGGWDRLVGSVVPGTSPEQELAKTMESKSHLFAGGAVPEMAGTALTGAVTEGLAPGLLTAKLRQTMGTGALTSGIQAEADKKSPINVTADMGIGGAFGAGAHGVATGAGKISSLLSGGTGAPNTSAQDLRDLADSSWDAIKPYVVPRKAVSDIYKAALNDATNSTYSIGSGAPMTEIANKPAWKLYEKFGDRFLVPDAPAKGTPGKAGTPVWYKELNDWGNAARALEGDDARYGGYLADRIDNLMQSGPTIKISPMGQKAEPMTPELQADYADTAYKGVLAARDATDRAIAASALDEAQATGSNVPIKQALHSDADLPPGVREILNQANRGNKLSRVADRVNKVIPNVSAAATSSILGGLGLRFGGWEPAIVASIAGLGAKPAVQSGTQAVSDLMRARMLQAARDQLTGAVRPAPDRSGEEAFRRLLLGGLLNYQ